MQHRKVVSKEEWLAARKAHLAKEKEFTRLRDQLNQSQRELPWIKVDKTYVFDTLSGKESLSDLFDGRSQLIVYHFMFGPNWEQGCKSCSLLADNYERSIVHLQQRDITMVTVSRGPLDELEAFKKRMSWTFKWVSSLDNDFNQDFHVSFPNPTGAEQEIYYNFQPVNRQGEEWPGLSVFYKDEDGTIYHTYSSYARGLDRFIGTYHLVDIVPKGRDEAELAYGMEWVKHHDRYE